MNRGIPVRVEAGAIRLLAVAAFVTVGGCVDIGGGAVDLSWTVRRVDRNESIGCVSEEARLSEVHLHATPISCANPPCGDAIEPAAWPCDQYHGSTRFEIPEGRWALEIEVTCFDGRTPSEVRVPDPIVRDITEGGVAQLNALLIAVDPQGTAAERCD